MTSKLTRERIEWLNYAATGLAANGTEMAMSPQDVIALTEYCLAGMDSEPVAFHFPGVPGFELSSLAYPDELDDVQRANCIPLYRHAQPAPDREHVRREHAEWSQSTFGNVGPAGPLKHLSKEALEAVAEPGDLSEWADMQFLLWDAQRRAGITDEQITQAMIEKLAVNKQREWPEPKDGEPRLHIKEQPAPLVQCPFPCGWDNLNKLAIQDAALVARGLVEGEPTTEAHRQAAISNNDRLLKVITACRAAMLQAGNSPVIPEGYVMVPKEPTSEMLRAHVGMKPKGWDVQLRKTWAAMLAAAQQEVKP